MNSNRRKFFAQCAAAIGVATLFPTLSPVASNEVRRYRAQYFVGLISPQGKYVQETIAVADVDQLILTLRSKFPGHTIHNLKLSSFESGGKWYESYEKLNVAEADVL